MVRVLSVEHRAKIGASVTGKRRTTESKEKSRQSALRRDPTTQHKWTDEQKAERSAKTKGRPGSKHGDETKARIRAARQRQIFPPSPLKGTKRSDEFKEKVRRGVLRWQASEAAFRWSRLQPTRLALDLADFLLSKGFDLVPEMPFGLWAIDLYEPNLHIGFEADGEFWHRYSKERDHRRDGALLARYGLRIIRFTEAQIKSLAGHSCEVPIN